MGLVVPTLSVLTAWCVHGGRWQSEPGIAPLVEPALASQQLPARAIQGTTQGLLEGEQQNFPRIPRQD